VSTDQKVDRQHGGSRQINTTAHSTPLTITSVQLNGTGRPGLVYRISVRDEEVVGSNPATPTVFWLVAGPANLLRRLLQRTRYVFLVSFTVAVGN
jgi:hypothetical protein